MCLPKSPVQVGRAPSQLLCRPQDTAPVPSWLLLFSRADAPCWQGLPSCPLQLPPTMPLLLLLHSLLPLLLCPNSSNPTLPLFLPLAGGPLLT